MSTQSTHLLERARRGTTAALRGFVDDVRRVIGAFPRIRDAFSADELPVAFILERDSRGFETSASKRPDPIPAWGTTSGGRPARAHATARRPGQRKPALDE